MTETKMDWFKAYKCPVCNDFTEMEPQEVRRVRDAHGLWILGNKYCLVCIGIGIQPIPYWELKGLTYEACREAWREENSSLS